MQCQKRWIRPHVITTMNRIMHILQIAFPSFYFSLLVLLQDTSILTHCCYSSSDLNCMLLVVHGNHCSCVYCFIGLKGHSSQMWLFAVELRVASERLCQVLETD